VRQEVPNGDRAPRPGSAIKKFRQRIGERQTAILDLQHHGGRGELLAERPRLKDRAVGDGNVVLDIREPVALRADDAVALDHGHSQAGDSL
jgi:hypothetical protein